MVCLLGCENITDIPYNFFEHAKLITDVSDLFAGCTGLTKITNDLLIPFNVNRLDRMFKSCTNLEINNMQLITYNKIVSAVELFSNCIRLKALPENFKLSNIIINFSGFCFNCQKLKTIPESFWPVPYFLTNIITLTNAFNTNSNILSAKLPSNKLWNDTRILWSAENAFYNPAKNIKDENGNDPDVNNWFRY